MDDDQQFCLRWNNHQSTLVSVFDTLLEKGIHVDCTLAAEGQTLKAHKVVLSACSPYFESVLSQQYDKHPIIILKDVKYAELRAMMDYMYRGEVNISQDQLAALLKAAESLQIKGLSDNKPSRPPSRPAPPAAPAPPPRAVSPPPQARDGSIDSREGSVSPTRRRKKARRLSNPSLADTNHTDDSMPAAAPPAPHPPPPAAPAACKEEGGRDTVEDLTIDEDAEEHPPVGHNDVVRNFQWHMERSQDELMNSSDGVRDSQETTLTLTSTLNYAKTPFPLTRGYLKKVDVKTEKKEKCRRGRKSIKNVTKVVKRKYVKRKYNDEEECSNLSDTKVVKKRKYVRRQCNTEEEGSSLSDKKYICSICKKKHYKYRRNKLRHEKYECITGPQFACELCGKKYSQKKTLVSHMALKHPNPLALNVKTETKP